MPKLTVYIAASFRHVHAVRLLSHELRRMGCEVFDWTEQAKPPEGLSAHDRRVWMDTDHGGEAYSFCSMACRTADLVIYLGASGQDAVVEVGMAQASGIPVLAVRGPLESPGLMLYGAADVWAESVDRALDILRALPAALPDEETAASSLPCRQSAIRANLIRLSRQCPN
jgi:hypothetical protein